MIPDSFAFGFVPRFCLGLQANLQHVMQSEGYIEHHLDHNVKDRNPARLPEALKFTSRVILTHTCPSFFLQF